MRSGHKLQLIKIEVGLWKLTIVYNRTYDMFTLMNVVRKTIMTFLENMNLFQLVFDGPAPIEYGTRKTTLELRKSSSS